MTSTEPALPALSEGMAEIVKHELAAAKGATGPTIRCDGCGVQGFVCITLQSGKELWLCSHQYNEYAADLELTAKVINDYRIVLQPIR